MLRVEILLVVYFYYFDHVFVFLFFYYRAKYHKLKYGTELNQGELKMPAFEPGWLYYRLSIFNFTNFFFFFNWFWRLVN